ncbi:MAG TPA: S8 family serine peptidase [Gemmatimonadaceae bacterium]|nr:S8 family serine peptidase [Gemmatimonadaceae bacterium]
MNRSLRFLFVSLSGVALAACDRVPDPAAPTAPISPNTMVVAPEERIGPGVLEKIRAGGNARIVVALNVPELVTTAADDGAPDGHLRVPPGLARLRSDVAAAQRAVIGRARREALVALRQYETVPAFSANVRSEEAVLAMATDPGVRRIDLDVGGTGQLASSVRVIGANERYEVGNRGQGVVVAILDSGIDTDHPDLADAVVHQACFGNPDGPGGVGFCPNGSDRQFGPGAAEDDAGHGTFVSGVVASNGIVSAPGVAPAASIVAIKVTDNCSSSGCFYAFSEIVAALDYIITNNATLHVRAINMSFGTSDLFAGACDNAAAFTMAGAAAINTLRSMGVIAFAAAGNNGSGTMMAAPACLSNVVSVGATNDDDVVAAFSNSNATTDIFAPGVSVTSDFLSGGTFTSPTGGTSAASPHAAGCAALLIDSGEALTPAAIETRLETSPFRVTDPTNGLTFPRIDCSYSALAALRGLINRVGTLGLRGNSASSYVGILKEALAYLEAGNVDATRSQLNAFTNYVRAQAGKGLTTAQADAMVLAATRVIAGAQAGYL